MVLISLFIVNKLTHYGFSRSAISAFLRNKFIVECYISLDYLLEFVVHTTFNSVYVDFYFTMAISFTEIEIHII